MPETRPELRSSVAETLLIPLYMRAMESQRPDALIKDEKAVALVTQSGLDFSQVRQIRMPELLNVMRNLFTREFDRYARDFLARHPDAVVVHIGCGLDSRFERVAALNTRVEWYDLDLPEVIELRRKLIGNEAEHYHLLACSVLEDAWLDAVKWACSAPLPALGRNSFRLLHRSAGQVVGAQAARPFPRRGAGLRRLETVRSLAGEPLSRRLAVCGPDALGLLARPGDRRLGQRDTIYLMSGASSTGPSRGWIAFAGWPPSFACSSRCASFTSSLERRQGEGLLFAGNKKIDMPEQTNPNLSGVARDAC